MTPQNHHNNITNTMIEDVQRTLSKLCDNYVTLLHRATNLSRATVSKFFNDHKVKPENAKKIFDAALHLVLANQDETKHRVQKYNQMRQNNSSTGNHPSQ